MAVKAFGEVDYANVSFVDGQLHVRILVNVGETQHSSVEAGSFAADADPAVVNLALANFVKAYAAAEMGVVFDVGDTARMLNTLVLTSSD
jgi:hypothetical protein